MRTLFIFLVAAIPMTSAAQHESSSAPVTDPAVRRLVIEVNPRWTPADCAVEALNALKKMTQGRDVAVVFVDDQRVDPTRRALVRVHFMERLFNADDLNSIADRRFRLHWPNRRPTPYAEISLEYPWTSAHDCEYWMAE